MSRTKIRCLPRGVCAWHFHLDGREHEADVELRGLRDQGRICIDGEHHLEVVRNHFAGRTWTLMESGRPAASAEKLPLRRSFELTGCDGRELHLRPETLFGRTLLVTDGSHTLAVIRPDHAFTRRATIEIGKRELDFPTACFAFWLAAMSWRRRARSN